jgi:hypothetical protein
MNTMIAEALARSNMWFPGPSQSIQVIHDELEHKLPKYIELRDSCTFVPVLATPVLFNPMTHKAGFSPTNTTIILMHLQTCEVQSEAGKWKSEWMAMVHRHIEAHWNEIKSQSMLDFTNRNITPEVVW